MSSCPSHLWSHSCISIIGGIFVCASWGLRMTDQMISVIAGPDDTGSIVPPDSTWSSSLCSKWTGGTLLACPSTISMLPDRWIAEGGSANSPYSGLTYSGISSYTSSPAGSPILPYSPYSPALAPPPLSGHPSPSGVICTGSFPGTTAGLELPSGFFPPDSAPASSALHTPAMAAMLGSLVPGLGTPVFGHFMPMLCSPLSGLAALPGDSVKKDD